MNVLNLETTDKRSKIMKSIKSSDTNIEVMLRKALWHNGVRYRKNFKVFDCHPDIVITKYKIAIFVMVFSGMVKKCKNGQLNIMLDIGMKRLGVMLKGI